MDPTQALQIVLKTLNYLGFNGVSMDSEPVVIFAGCIFLSSIFISLIFFSL